MSAKEKEINLKFTAEIHQEEDWYVATNLELGITSQGRTEQEAIEKLREATELYLEDMTLEELQALPQHKDPVLTTFNTRMSYA